jgi:putative transposase
MKGGRCSVLTSVANGVGVIRMEDLTEIRNRAKFKSEPGRSLHFWEVDQLKEMFRYKAEIAGIRVEMVHLEYTRQTCKCGYREKASRNGIRFKCKKCGYTIHADQNGTINIVISGLAAWHTGNRYAVHLGTF